MNTSLFFKGIFRYLFTLGIITILLSATKALAASGTLDSSFGTNGIVTTQFNGLPSSASEVVLQADGKIITLGTIKLSDEQSTKIITRYNSNGTVDASFGTNGSMPVEVELFSGSKIALQPDGKLIVGGLSGSALAVVRYNSNGTLDTSFGTNGMGIYTLWYSEIRQYLSDIAVQADGKIVAVGDITVGQSNYDDIVFARFNSDGTKDTGDTVYFPNSRYNYSEAVVIQPDGKIVISGNMMDNDGKNQLSLARLNQDGLLDKSTFGTNGTVETQLSDFQSSRGALAIQPDGKIIVGGTTAIDVNQNLALIRYNSNGTLDTTFGGTGIVTSDFGNSEQVDDLVIQTDGKIIVEGKTTSLDASDFLLARYNSDGSLDTTFGTSGKVVTDFGSSTDNSLGVAQQPDGKIIVIGASGGNAILARYDMGVSISTVSLSFKSVGSQDGWVLESGENSGKGGTLEKMSNVINLGDDAKDRQYRGILSFDTESIPDNVTLTSAQVKIKKQGVTGADPFSTHGNLLLEIRSGTFNNDIALSLGDFSAIADAGSTKDKFSAADASWYSASLSNANLGLINKYGATQFRLLFVKDDNDDMGADYVKFFSGNSTTDQPQLIVTYSASGTSNQAPVITSNGGGATANISLSENTIAVTTVTAIEPDAELLTYSISGGADAALFSINPSDGILSFVTAPSYNAPNDAGLDHVYNVTVQASDGVLPDSQELVISIINPNLPTGTMLDPTFGANGVVTTKTNGLPSSTWDVILQPDGKVVTLGTAQSQKVITRYNSNGTLDTSFGINGSTFIEVTTFSAKKLALQPDGKLIVAGKSGGFAAVRYNSNGALDTSFGTNGLATINADTENYYSVEDVTVQPDGKIVLAGDFQFRYGNHIDFEIVRFNSDGTRDVINTINFPYEQFDYGKAVVIQPDNKIIMSGYMQGYDGDYYIPLVRLNPDLRGDSSFGSNNGGTIITPLDYYKSSSGALALQPDGKIVVAGTIFNRDMDVPQNLVVARFNSNGALDTSFGGTGIVVTDFGAEESTANLVIQASGKIIVAGTTTSAGASDFLLVRYNSDGSLDSSFGASGKLTTDFGNSAESVSGIVQQPDGKIIVSGNSGENAILARYDTGVSGTTNTASFKSASANDGWILESGENSSRGGTLDKVSNVIYLGDDTKDRQYRGILSFDTNSIPDNVTITSVQVKIKKQGVAGADPFSTHGNLLLEIRNGTFNNDLALSLGDFSASAEAGSTKDKFSAEGDNWYSASLSSANLGLVNKVGVTQFRLLFTKDDNDDMGADYVKFFSGNAASDQPQLIVTYSSGGAGNQAPIINGGAALSISIPENTMTVAGVTATDPNGHPITYSISGTDAGKFSINASNGILTFLTAPDFESIPVGTVYHLTAQASDGSLTAAQDIFVTVTAVNEFAPVVTSNTNISLPENTLDVTTITATDADLPTQSIQYIFAGGADDSLFNFDSSTGKLSFVTAPSYNAPNDAGLDHVYNVKFEINDGEFVTPLELVISIISNPATSFTALHQFGSQADNGRVPYGVLTLYDGVLYGTTTYGGAPYNVPPTNPANKGNVFKMNMDGTGFTILHEFTGGSNDGWKPWVGLAISGDMIFGSTVYGGPRGESGGVIYEMNLDGSGFRVLHAFGEAGDGFGGSTSPIHVGDTLYGLTRWGGNGTGTIYSYNTTTEVYTQLHRFAANSSDGNAPLGTLTAANDGFLYGATWLGGKNNMGTLFRIKPDGSAFETLYNFAGGAQGKYPYDTLAFDGNHTFYGTTLGEYGVNLSDLGTVFKYDITSKAYSVLHKFAGGANDGGKPNGSVVLSSDGVTLYGSTHGDDAWGGSEYGILYQMNIDGTGFQQLHEFKGGTAGATPMHTPLLINGALYGMTAYGGAENYGLIYLFQVADAAASQLRLAPMNVNAYNPIFTSGNTISISENNIALTTVTATDADVPVQSLTYSITGSADSSLFSINPATGELVFIAAPNYEIPTDAGLDNIYNMTVQVSDGVVAITQDVAVTIAPANDNNPVITSNNAISISENTTTVATLTATDADIPAQPLTYSIAGGADSARFNINPSTGELTFITAPDFEIPTDAVSDNIYNVTVQVSDGELVNSQEIAVTVNAVNDNTPAITSNGVLSISENSTVIAAVTATDADLPPQPLTYSIAGGSDSTLFAINPSTGELTFTAAPDYEIQKDAGMDNIYNVTVQASDGTLASTQDIAVTVTPINDNIPIITSPASFSVSENITAISATTATDADLPAETLTYAIIGGADSALFTINTSTGALDFITARDFETPNDVGSDNIYNLIIQASDGTLTVTQDVSVTILPVNDNSPAITSPNTFSIPENTSTIANLIATDADHPAQPLSYSIVGGTDAVKFSIVSATGELKFVAAPDFEIPTDVNLDNAYEVVIQVSDGTYNVTQNISVKVADVANQFPFESTP